MERFKAVIFDLDGTLCCTLPDLLGGVNFMLGELGLPPQTEEGILPCASMGLEGFIRYSLPERFRNDEETVKKALAIYSPYYIAHSCDKTYVYPGLADVIGEWKKAGLRLAVFTNKPLSQTDGILKKLFPAGTFEAVICADPYPPKPDLTGFYEIMNRFGVTPEETLYLGDSDIDMKTGSRGGAYTVGVTWGYCKPEVLTANGADLLVSRPEELRTLTRKDRF